MAETEIEANKRYRKKLVRIDKLNNKNRNLQ